ncbi:alpha/beta hydrolase [Candidatus Woesearchaeota archaeon]|nr:MAG: alpha/beta hydrolase [Candidatus Woesearchaeota archaeon]
METMNQRHMLVSGNAIPLYQSSENGKPRVAFFPGFGLSLRHFERFVAELENQYHVTFFGINGLSGKSVGFAHPPRSVNENVELAYQAIQQSGIETELDYLAGHSFGGALAIRLATQQSVDKIVALAPLLPTSRSSYSLILQGLRRLLQDGDFGYIKNALAEPSLLSKLTREVSEHSYEDLRGRIQQPCLIVEGEKDFFFPNPLTRMSELYALGSNVQVLTLSGNTDHVFPITHTKDTARAIESFLT